MNEQRRVKQTCTPLGASQAIGVCRALVATYDKVVADKGLAKDERAFVSHLLGPCRERLAQAGEALDGAAAAQGAVEGPAQPAAGAALAAYRTPWRTLRDGLRVGVRVERETGAAGADALFAAVFGGGSGIPFLARSPYAAWTDAGKALDALRAAEAREVLARHHLTEQLGRVEAAHAAYGRAIGVTGSLVPRPAEARASVRETLDACTAAICDYVTRACAVEDPARPGSDALLSRLLAALESVPRVHERARKPAAEDEGDAGEEGDEDGEDGEDADAAKGEGEDPAPENGDADAEPAAPRKVG